ncbi:MAG: Xaa-Pro aminopeptidase [Gammaproteobacteria bacterium]
MNPVPSQQSWCKQKRQQLCKALPKDSAAIIFANHEQQRSNDTYFIFRQHSDFHYLTAFPEPDAVMVLLPNREAGEFVLFNRPADPAAEQWDGKRVGQTLACEYYQADQAYALEQLDVVMPTLLAGYHTVYYALGQDSQHDKKVMQWLDSLRKQQRKGITMPRQLADIRDILHEQRLIKDDYELEQMRHVINISARTHALVMQHCRPLMYEYQLEALLTQEFRSQGCQGHAYAPIVASGANACTLHYITNNRQIEGGDLVLIDAGAEYQCYAADITRTFPANGKFSAEQRAIYEVVLQAQLAAIQVAKPRKTWDNMQEVIIKVICEGLCELGLLQGSLEELIETKAYRQFYMHNSGHWLGLDVHDVGAYKQANQWRKLQPGMVLTIEPGIYISPGDPRIAKKWWGIGVRIEDDVLITKKGNEILSAAVPKTIEDIEALMAS